MAAAPAFLHHPSSLEHDTGHHPEQPARISAIIAAMEEAGWLGCDPVQSAPAELAAVEAIHSPAYVESVMAVCDRGGGHLDIDTVLSGGSCTAAMHAAGGAIELVDRLLDRSIPTGFSAHRPPGHHALSARAMGFCLFNNVAIAARHALAARGAERVMIFDWDVHHGNGTNDIFHGTREVLFVSIHQSPLYPGTGSARDLGSGEGEGYTVNVPVSPGADDVVFGSVVDHVVAPLLDAFRPDLLLVSAGYDAHREDPLADLVLTETGYAAMTRSLRFACESLAIPFGFVLEGGYALGALSRSVVATLRAAGAEPLEPPSPMPLTPVAREVRERLARWWPSLD